MTSAVTPFRIATNAMKRGARSIVSETGSRRHREHAQSPARPCAAILAERRFLRHPMDLLLALPEVERPGIFERPGLLAGFGEGHGGWSLRLEKQHGEKGG